MTVLDQKTILPEYIKLRWHEPYVSGGLNRTMFKSMPRGVYNGFVIVPGPGPREVTVAHDDPSGWGLTSGYAYGAFDTASGWSVAVHSSMLGFNTAIVIQAGAGKNYEFDLDSYGGESVYLALDVQYDIATDTAGQVKLVDAAALEANPALVVLGRVDVPASADIEAGNIVYDDPAYPRVLPYANIYKSGFMSKEQALSLDYLQTVSGSPAFVYETEMVSGGPQVIDLPPGFEYVVGGHDLWVHKNGIHKTVGALRDYIEIDRGDGRGEQILYVGLDLKEGDRVKLRIQQYAVAATSTLQVMDENAVIDTNVITMRFTGTGVQVFPDGPRRVRVAIGGSGGGGSTVKTKANITGSTIPGFRALALIPADNTVKLFDPGVSGEVFYGISLQDIPDEGYGDAQVDGIVVGGYDAVSGSGAIGDEVYVLPGGSGMLTTTPPDPLSSRVVKVGFLDGADAVSGATPTDIIFDREELT